MAAVGAENEMADFVFIVLDLGFLHYLKQIAVMLYLYLIIIDTACEENVNEIYLYVK